MTTTIPKSAAAPVEAWKVQAALEASPGLAALAGLCGGMEEAMEAFARWAEEHHPPHPAPACAVCRQLARSADEQIFHWSAAVRTLRTFWRTLAEPWSQEYVDPASSLRPYKVATFQTRHVLCPNCAESLQRRRRWASRLSQSASLGLALSLTVALPALCFLGAMAVTPGQIAWGFAWTAAGSSAVALFCALALFLVRRVALPMTLRTIGRRPFLLQCVEPLDGPSPGNSASA